MNTQSREIQRVDPNKSRRVFSPRADIYETAADIVVLADMPGVNEKSIDVNLEKNVLTLEGRKTGFQSEKHDLIWSEYVEGDYHRRFVLGEEIDQDRISASVRNGVLKLVLPKSSKAKSRKIPIALESERRTV